MNINHCSSVESERKTKSRHLPHFGDLWEGVLPKQPSTLATEGKGVQDYQDNSTSFAPPEIEAELLHETNQNLNTLDMINHSIKSGCK